MNIDLEREVRDLLARRDITQAIHDYMRGQDRLDRDVQLRSFHADADVDCGLLRGGPEAYTDFAQGFLANLESSQHLLGQIDLNVDIDEGTASGEVYFFAWHRTNDNDEAKDLFMAGRYIDEYACKDGKWAIQRRRELIDWARHDPASDSILHEMTAIHLSGRHGEDFSQTRDWTSGTSGR
ncbi:nuclear transport factor 2 family protein [Sphingobium sp. SCG-1]|uniref:nuclear transport factor 2 family protein n=1 Tax=Sphingobium sp. SCG-1 TaxID=2072936 RepID=UPI000CD68DAD|nr:nuclear transport factor 2 family protein [Sphingobium sp. SCG-1]AUW58940.1 nuclear transport factor 2 family protein [Sphingobium sp. SCG-1]